ncbi:MAG TPA: hypothetical protein VHM91_04215, partial [Verrucomicrobiales bacterium]|nr:hypothetical protein [Verrucomicrobiales bacterium]
MKTLPLLFSLPLLVGALAHAAPAPGSPDVSSVDSSLPAIPDGTSEVQKLISQIDDKLVAALSLPGTAAALTGSAPDTTDCCPARRDPAFFPATYSRKEDISQDGSTIPTAAGE